MSALRWPDVTRTGAGHRRELAPHGFTHSHSVHLSETAQRPEIECGLEMSAQC